MSLVAGPGRGGSHLSGLPDELELCVEKHVAYIKSLDTVRVCHVLSRAVADSCCRGKMSMSIG